MAYPILCLLPHNRFLQLDSATMQVTAVPLDCEGEEAVCGGSGVVAPTTVRVQMKGSDVVEVVDVGDLGYRVCFVYAPRNVFLHENEFRNCYLWSIDNFEDFSISKSDEQVSINSIGPDIEAMWKEHLTAGLIHNQLLVKFVSDSAGYGLYAGGTIPANTFIGEYVGIIYSGKHHDSARCQYVLSYPSCEGNMNINATEQGNITRFINHCDTESALNNVTFRTLVVNGFCSVICVTTKEILAGSQLLVDYGKSFWVGKEEIAQFDDS
jgi:hypothetical protein